VASVSKNDEGMTGLKDMRRKTKINLPEIIQYFSLIFTVVFMIGGWYLQNVQFALSIFLGGLLANGSYWMLKRDTENILKKIVDSGSENVRTVQRIERIRFIFKFYAKLVVLGLLLYAASMNMQLNMIGVALGLSTVMLSVFVVVLGGGRKIYSIQSVRGA
jgi:hypothetical protein